MVLAALLLPPLVWLAGSGTRPDAPLLTLLPSGHPLRLEVSAPGRLRAILLASSAPEIQSILARGGASLPSREDPLDVTPESFSASASASSSHPDLLQDFEASLTLRFLYARLTAFALVHDPTRPPADGTAAVFTVDNLGQALLRVALPLLGEESGDGYRLVIGGIPFAILHEGGSLFRIGTRPRPDQTTLKEASPLLRTYMDTAAARHILDLEVTGTVFAPWPALERAVTQIRVSIVETSSVTRLVGTIDGQLPPSIPQGLLPLGNTGRRVWSLEEMPGLQFALGASLDELRRFLWAWHGGRETVPRVGVALPWESDLDAVLQDLAATSDGGGVSGFVVAPTLEGETFGVPPVPEVVFVWRAHPDAERVASHLDRAMERFAQAVRAISLHPLEQRVLGQTEWVPDGTGAPGGTIRMHPLFFHHLAPTVTVRDGFVFLSTYPGDWAAHIPKGGGVPIREGAATGDIAGEAGMRVAWQADAALQACLVALAHDCLIRKAWVAERDHPEIRRIVEGMDALVRVWSVFTLRMDRPDAGEPNRVRVVWDAPLP